MLAINSAQVLEGNYDAWEKELMPLHEKETVEWYSDHFNEPRHMFRGVIIGLLLCLPFWTIIFSLITWLLISIHLLKFDIAKISNCVLLSPKVMIPRLNLQLTESEDCFPTPQVQMLWFLALCCVSTYLIENIRFYRSGLRSSDLY